ncbi:60S ribosomal protein L6-2, putative [Plasmodium ovale wallikeri]|uniref:60S ribosomal protein L6-2, putative n=2 Tax=Plasmodium ovale TaxID=36330 RepID=A0A1C3KV29_PLAOA|nr:60S ribosomal protein L6-2, putative [Plasmodium ovale wallikeri]SBT78048.1 60S ribosomal protein L6-2, putative [Plasmodium ovale]
MGNEKKGKKEGGKVSKVSGDSVVKYYTVKGKKKELIPIKAKKTIAKKYYGKKLASKKKYMVKRKMRKSIEVGKVAILLAGKYMGKRCIITKILDSGLLAIMGPYEINGVPLKRVDPRYVIVTSTNIFNFTKIGELKEKFINMTENINDNTFVRNLEIKKKQKKILKKKEGLFMNNAIEQFKAIWKEDPKVQKLRNVQSELGDLLKSEILKEKVFCAYLKSRFTLRNDMSLHRMKF